MRNAQKELAAAGRKLEKLAGQIAQVHARMAEHDPGDYAGLSSLSEELSAFQLETTRVETRWLELSELLGD